MRKSVYQSIISVLILVIVLSVFAVLKTSVSIGLETTSANDCISHSTGQDLCGQLVIFKIVIIVCLIVVTGLLGFRNTLVNQ